MTERLMLGLRLDRPLELGGVEDALDRPAAERLASAGLVELQDGTIRLSERGRYMANERPCEHPAMSGSQPGLTPRQALILTHVVSEYIATGHPVGSKALVEAGVVDASSSTVRYELAELETRGLLGHPHTSAGRVPTDAGYRIYAEHLIEQPLGRRSCRSTWA